MYSNLAWIIHFEAPARATADNSRSHAPKRTVYGRKMHTNTAFTCPQTQPDPVWERSGGYAGIKPSSDLNQIQMRRDSSCSRDIISHIFQSWCILFGRGLCITRRRLCLTLSSGWGCRTTGGLKNERIAHINVHTPVVPRWLGSNGFSSTWLLGDFPKFSSIKKPQETF